MGICLDAVIPMGCGIEPPPLEHENFAAPPRIVCVCSAGFNFSGVGGFLLPKNMIVSKIVNRHPAEGFISELTVQGSTICISELLNGKKWSRLQFDLHCSDDVDWIIQALTNVSNQLKAKRELRHKDQGKANASVTIEQAKEQFSKMREMLMG